MFGLTPARLGDQSLGQGNESPYRALGVRDANNCTVISSDARAVGRASEASATVESRRPIQVLAALLYPFAGTRSHSIAERLIARFGSPSAVVFANSRQLEDIEEDDRDIARLIVAARNLLEISLREEVLSDAVRVDDKALQDYLMFQLGSAPDERLLAIFVDANGQFLKEEIVSIGTRGGVSSRMSILFRRVLDLRAAGILLAHNHPSGECSPSDVDLANTQKLKETAERLDVHLIDHLVVTRKGVFSILRGRIL